MTDTLWTSLYEAQLWLANLGPFQTQRLTSGWFSLSMLGFLESFGERGKTRKESTSGLCLKTCHKNRIHSHLQDSVYGLSVSWASFWPCCHTQAHFPDSSSLHRRQLRYPLWKHSLQPFAHLPIYSHHQCTYRPPQDTYSDKLLVKMLERWGKT